MLESEISTERYSSVGVRSQNNEKLEFEARIAIDMIIKWGVVAAKQDGEDSAGRSKMTSLEANELVDKAFEIAELSMKKAREKNLVHKEPTLAQLKAVEKEEKEKSRLEKAEKIS